MTVWIILVSTSNQEKDGGDEPTMPSEESTMASSHYELFTTALD